MRVLIFSTAYIPFIGGAEVAVKEITDRLGGELEFDLITARLSSNLPKFERVGEVNVYRIGWGSPLVDKLILPFAGAVKALNLNKERRYDYFWGVMASFATGAGYVANILRGLVGKRSIPIVLSLQEGDSEMYLRTKWFGLVDLSWRLALKRTTVLTAISNYLLERGQRLGFKGESVLVPNGVDVQKFANHKPKVFDSNNVVLITTSRLVAKNGVADVIKALVLLPETVKFKVIGTGKLLNSLKNLAERTGVFNRVEFAGEVSPSEVPNLLHQADIFVRPSLSEGFGNSFIEAMAAGLPVVATPVGGIPDFLKDGETGLYCPKSSPEGLSRAILRLIEDSALRGRLVTNALQMVRSQYDWSLIAETMKSKVFKSQ